MRLSLLAALLVACLGVCPPSAGAGDGAEKELRLGFIYVSPVGDAGWSYVHDLARIRLAGEPGIKTYFMERVPEGPGAERPIRNMSRKGYDIIITTSLGYMEPTLKVAADFPGITYLHCSGNATAPNVSSFFGRMYQARYLSGLVAGQMSKNNVIGYVAAFPVPEVIRGINAFTLGAREANPGTEVRVAWTETWYNPEVEAATAKQLIDGGADVIAQHQDSPGPQEAAQERGVYSIGYNTDMSQFAPQAHLVAAVWNWLPFYEEVVRRVRAGTWSSGAFWDGMSSGIVDISDFGPMVPPDVRASVSIRRQEIISGMYTVFTGPLKDQSGAIRIPEGAVMSDEELLGMDWFVQGVVGEVP